jgi:hypothetical protein
LWARTHLTLLNPATRTPYRHSASRFSRYRMPPESKPDSSVDSWIHEHAQTGGWRCPHEATTHCATHHAKNTHCCLTCSHGCSRIIYPDHRVGKYQSIASVFNNLSRNECLIESMQSSQALRPELLRPRDSEMQGHMTALAGKVLMYRCVRCTLHSCYASSLL